MISHGVRVIIVMMLAVSVATAISAISTKEWRLAKSTNLPKNLDLDEGLFETCVSTDGQRICSDYESSIKDYGKYKACQGLAIASIVLQVFALGIAVYLLVSTTPEHAKAYWGALVMFSALGGILMSICVGVFSSTENADPKDLKYGYSFVLAIVSAVISFGAVIPELVSASAH